MKTLKSISVTVWIRPLLRDVNVPLKPKGGFFSLTTQVLVFNKELLIVRGC